MANYVLDKGYIPDGSSAVVAYRFCTLGSDDQHIDLTPNSQGILVLGVVMDNMDAAKVTTGKSTVDVRLMGIAPVTVGTTNVVLGTEVMTMTDGRAIPITGTGARVAGIALQSGTAGDIVNVLLKPAGRAFP